MHVLLCSRSVHSSVFVRCENVPVWRKGNLRKGEFWKKGVYNITGCLCVSASNSTCVCASARSDRWLGHSSAGGGGGVAPGFGLLRRFQWLGRCMSSGVSPACSMSCSTISSHAGGSFPRLGPDGAGSETHSGCVSCIRAICRKRLRRDVFSNS